MRIGFFVNDVRTEESTYTTIRLAVTATNLGHEVWLMGAGDFAYEIDDKIHARARSVKKKNYKSLEKYLHEIQGKSARVERICVDDLDTLVLRSDPSLETGHQSWAQSVGIIFGRAAMRHGVIVLNDPDRLAKAMNKMYFQMFPEEVSPKTLITRDFSEIKSFAKDHGGDMVIKPLQGSGGKGVFLVRPDDLPNLNQMIEAVIRDGYVVAQEYLPDAAKGDTRLFLMNGRPLLYKGKYAAFRRVRTGGDVRSNLHAEGSIEKAEIGDEALRIAEIVRPKLVQDGMFLVGLDIVGNKLMEINVFTPGGLASARQFEKVNFASVVINATDRKVQYNSFYRRNFDNVELTTL